ncbi:hypothetical protein JCM10213_003102 [Rhodosporidiobolus nylandii]
MEDAHVQSSEPLAPTGQAEAPSFTLADVGNSPLSSFPPFFRLNEPAQYSKKPKPRARNGRLTTEDIASRFPGLPFSHGILPPNLCGFDWKGGVEGAYTLLEISPDAAEEQLLERLWCIAIAEFRALVAPDAQLYSNRLGGVLVIACSRILLDKRPVSPFSSIVRLIYTREASEALCSLQLPLPRVPSSAGVDLPFALSPIILSWIKPLKPRDPAGAITNGWTIVADPQKSLKLESWGLLVDFEAVGLDLEDLTGVNAATILDGHDWTQIYNLDLSSLPGLVERAYRLLSRKLLEKRDAPVASPAQQKQKKPAALGVAEDKKLLQELVKARTELAAERAGTAELKEQVERLEREKKALELELGRTKRPVGQKMVRQKTLADASAQTASLDAPASLRTLPLLPHSAPISSTLTSESPRTPPARASSQAHLDEENFAEPNSLTPSGEAGAFLPSDLAPPAAQPLGSDACSTPESASPTLLRPPPPAAPSQTSMLSGASRALARLVTPLVSILPSRLSSQAEYGGHLPPVGVQLALETLSQRVRELRVELEARSKVPAAASLTSFPRRPEQTRAQPRLPSSSPVYRLAEQLKRTTKKLGEQRTQNAELLLLFTKTSNAADSPA